MSDTRYIQLASLLIDLECELRRAGYWSAVAPAAEALASNEPFCIDTLDFSQWLQFVFLPRMHALLADRQSLPQRCDIASMAETVWAGHIQAGAVIATLKAFDEMITAQARPMVATR